ncbi:MAG: hypothetical protein ABIO86_06350 [Sphingomonas sp.]
MGDIRNYADNIHILDVIDVMQKLTFLGKMRSASIYAGITSAAALWVIYRLMTLTWHVDGIGKSAFPPRFWDGVRERFASRLLGHELSDAVDEWIAETGDPGPDQDRPKG